jgi:hypothetical protein
MKPAFERPVLVLRVPLGCRFDFKHVERFDFEIFDPDEHIIDGRVTESCDSLQAFLLTPSVH